MPKNRLPFSRLIVSVPFRYWFACATIYPRSQFLSHAVCETIIAATAAPITSMNTMTSA